ncbi:MAG: hypothetical protein ACRDGU_07375, partial [Actinomycetota bacterium]
ARVDGERVPLRPADHAGVAVLVPPGRHLVSVRYEPESWNLGKVVSGLSLVALLGVALLGRRVRPKSEVDYRPTLT